jgi:histidinol dehydrogenase
MKIVSYPKAKSGPSSNLKAKASQIIKETKDKGPSILEVTANGRGVYINPETLIIAGDHVDIPLKGTLEQFIRIQEKVALRQYETVRPCSIEPTAGIKIHQEVRAIESMAVVAPGEWGEEIPETMASILVAARIAGVSKRIVLLRPDSSGGISPVSLFAAGLAEATDVYRAGGVPGMVGLTEGWTGDIPEKIFLVGGTRLERMVHNTLVKTRLKKSLDLVVFADSKSGVEPILATLSSWFQDNPFGKALFITTSKRILNRLEVHIAKEPEPRPYWWKELQNLQVVIAPSFENALEILKDFSIDYLAPFTSQSLDKILALPSVNHYVFGDMISPLISKRGLFTGITAGNQITDGFGPSGVFSFLRTITIEEIDVKAGERLKAGFRQLNRIKF